MFIADFLSFFAQQMSLSYIYMPMQNNVITVAQRKMNLSKTCVTVM